MNGFTDDSLQIEDRQVGLLIDDAGMNASNDELQWFLSQHSSLAVALDDNNLGWEDIGGPSSFEAIRRERRFSQGSSLWDGSNRSASGSRTQGTKRRRLPEVSASISIPFQARQKALHQLSAHGRKRGDCLVEMENLACEENHCFAMEPIGANPRDYSGESMKWGNFQVRIIEPPTTLQRLEMRRYLQQTSPLARPTGRSLHLIVASYPKMAIPQSLESGFALIIVCHKMESSEQWSLLSLASFTGTAQKTKTISSEAHFVANLDRCKKAENGKRIWGERTSHVKHDKRPAKAIRLEPRGPAQAFTNGQQYCIIVTLHDPQGKLLLDINDTPCIAQSNPFFFQSQQSELAPQSRKLLEQFQKLSMAERSMLAFHASSSQSQQVLLDNAYDTQIAAGIFLSSKDNQLPLTACALSNFYQDDSMVPTLTQEYILRLQAVANYLGKLHANPDLTDDNIRFLRTHNCNGAEGRYMNLGFGGMMDQNQEWLIENGIHIKLIDAYNRIQILQHIMHTREYRSHWIICVGNVYPPEVMVDRNDVNKVHCLLDRLGTETLNLSDRLYPLARLAYCSKLPRSLFNQVFFAPYIKAFQDAGGNGTNEEPLHQEKFWLIIQAMFIEFFFYWTELRNPGACLRIQERLLADDDLLDDKFFGPSLMHKFSLN